jgi:RimJ/RimL family protein N-acetyltransferase
MGWRDDEYRDAGLAIDRLQDEQVPFYRHRYTFGIVPDHVDALAGVAVVTIGQAEPAQFPPVWQTDLTIFFAQQFRGLGYGRRTLTMLRNWCFDELRLTSPFGESVRMSKVTAVCLPGNEAARTMLSDLLAPQGATILKHKTDGSPVEALLFSMTREQYEKMRQQSRLQTTNPVPCQNSSIAADQQIFAAYAALRYSLIRPPRTCLRSIAAVMSATWPGSSNGGSCRSPWCGRWPL